MKRDRSRRRRRDPSTSLSAPPPKRTSSEKHSRRPKPRAKHDRRSKSAPRKRARQEQDTHSSARGSTDKSRERLFVQGTTLSRFPPEVFKGPPQTLAQQGKETHPSTFFLFKSHLTHLYIFITQFYHLLIFSCTRGQCYSSFLSFIYFVYATGDRVVGRHAQHHHVLPDREVCPGAD